MDTNEIDELVAAAIAAEKWFTHQECVGNETLDTDAYQIADKLRGALGLIETGDSELLKRASDIRETFDDEGFLFGRPSRTDTATEKAAKIIAEQNGGNLIDELYRVPLSDGLYNVSVTNGRVMILGTARG